MEIPNSKNRWDKPLFHLRPEESTPCEEITNCLLYGKKPRVPIATKTINTFDNNFLYEIDKECRTVIDVIIESQNQLNIGEFCSFPNIDKKLKLNKIITIAELKKLK